MSRDYIDAKKRCEEQLSRALVHLNRLIRQKERWEERILEAAKRKDDTESVRLNVRLKNVNALIVRYDEAIAKERRYLVLVQKKINEQD